MARPKLTTAQVRDRKAKKRLAAVLSVVFAGVLAFQAPTILKLVRKLSSSAYGALPATSTTAASAQPAAGTSAAAPAGSQVDPCGRELRLRPRLRASSTTSPSFADQESLPFAQAGAAVNRRAVSTSSKRARQASKAAEGAGANDADQPVQAEGQARAKKPIPVTARMSTVPFSTAPAVPPNAALILTNGKREIVPVGKSFPRGRPLFKLVSLATRPEGDPDRRCSAGRSQTARPRSSCGEGRRLRSQMSPTAASATRSICSV